MKQKIKKLCKILNRFKIEEIISISEIEECEIEKILNELIEEKYIKQISLYEYVYIPKINILNEILEENKNMQISEVQEEWVNVEQASNMTGFAKETIRRKCKRGYYECKYTRTGKYKNYLIKRTSIEKDTLYNPLKIKLDKKIREFNLGQSDQNVFNTKEEQKIFDEAEDFNKHHIIKYLNIFKLTDGLRGNDLRKTLKDIGNNNPAYNVSYCSYVRWKAAFIENGVKGLLKKYHAKDKGKSCVPDDLLQEFASIYLNSRQYSIRVSWEILKSRHPDEILPSDKSFNRALTKKYSKKYMQNIRKHNMILPNIKFNNSTPQVPEKKIFEKVNDAFNEELNKFKNKKDNRSICRVGYIKNHLQPYWGKYKFKDITQEALIKYECKMLADGYTTSSIKRFVALFQKIINKYSNTTDLSYTSNETLLPSLVTSTLKPKEIREIIENKTRLPELWILCLGISPSELGALNYSDIDYKKRTVKISKTIFRGQIEKIRAKYKIREMKIPQILFIKIPRKNKGTMFKNLSIENYDILLNTHIKLLLDKNIQINIISKNIGYYSIREFEQRYNFLLPQSLDEGFEIL